MSRYDGWLVRFIVMLDTPAAMTIKRAAKGAGIRADTFAEALRDPKLIRQDARHLGMDPDDMLWVHRWVRLTDAEEERTSTHAYLRNAKAVTPKRNSQTYNRNRTRIGVTCPNPGGARDYRDELNLPINPVQHPEPQGEWHSGLDAAG